jgi:hypothetical protein
MLAIKQLTGLSFFVAGAQVDLSQLRSSLTAVNTEILGYDVDTLSKFKMEKTQDFDALSRQVMPALKQFLSQKDKSLMGVKPSNDADGRQRWLCDGHYVNTGVGGDVPNYKASNRQSGGSGPIGTPAYETFTRTVAPTGTVTAAPTTAPTSTIFAAPSNTVALANDKSKPVNHMDKALPPTPTSGFGSVTLSRNFPGKDSQGGYTPNQTSSTYPLPIATTEFPKSNYHNPYLNTDRHSSDTKQGYNSLERGQTISGISHATDPPKTNYYNPYLNADAGQAHLSNAQLERGQTISGISHITEPPKTNYHNPYLNAESGSPNAQLERGQTVSGYTTFNGNGHYPSDHGQGYPQGNQMSPPVYSLQNTTSPPVPPVIQYPHDHQSYASNTSHQYPPSYPSTSPYSTSPSQLYTPLAMRSVSPVPSDTSAEFNPLLPLTLQRGYQPPKPSL